MSIEVRFSSPHMPTKVFSSLEECINHEDYHQIEDLHCKGIGLTQLPDILPSNLKVLWCDYNNLTQLPNELPDTLQILNCAGNRFTSLPNNLPPNIYDLICHSNQIVSLPDNLPIGLTRLHCSHNNIVTLPENLPPNLQSLVCGTNPLISLPAVLPTTLTFLCCANSRLTFLPENLPLTLEFIFCNDNQLTDLAISLTRLINIKYFYHINNLIQHIPPQVRRWLNALERPQTLRIYHDTQNIHDHNIQKCIRESIEKLTSQKFTFLPDKELVFQEILSDTILSEQCKSSILEYCQDNTVHSTLHLTFKELLGYVWKTIEQNEAKGEIKKALNAEMLDASCKCFTGRLSRLLNCLNGFTDLVKIGITDSQQIGNIIVLVKERLEAQKIYTVEKHKDIVKKELTERGYSEEVIAEWVQYIE